MRDETHSHTGGQQGCIYRATAAQRTCSSSRQQTVACCPSTECTTMGCWSRKNDRRVLVSRELWQVCQPMFLRMPWEVIQTIAEQRAPPSSCKHWAIRLSLCKGILEAAGCAV